MVRKIRGKRGGGRAFSLVSIGFQKSSLDFPGSAENRNLPVNAGDTGLVQEDPTCHRATKPRCPNY